MSPSLITVSYLGAAALFILALGGLSSNETARRGNLFGIIGMTIAVLVTIAAFVTNHHEVLIAIMIAGGIIGFISFIAAMFFGTPLILNLSVFMREGGDEVLFFVQPVISVQLILALLIGGGMIAPMVAGLAPTDSMFLLVAAYSASLAGVILTAIVSGKAGLGQMFRRLHIWRVGGDHCPFRAERVLYIFDPRDRAGVGVRTVRERF